MTSTPRLNYFLISIVIVSALTLIVFAAITANSLEELIGGVVKVGLVTIVLAAIGVILFERVAKAKNELNKENHHHAEQMAGQKVLVSGYGFPLYEWAEQQAALPDPDAEKRKRLAQVNFYSNDPVALASNLVLYSMVENGEQSNRICGMPIPGCSGRAWTMASQYLQNNYGVVSTRGAGGGTFVSDDVGNLFSLYQKMTISALPGVTR